LEWWREKPRWCSLLFWPRLSWPSYYERPAGTCVVKAINWRYGIGNYLLTLYLLLTFTYYYHIPTVTIYLLLLYTYYYHIPTIDIYQLFLFTNYCHIPTNTISYYSHIPTISLYQLLPYTYYYHMLQLPYNNSFFIPTTLII